MTPKIVTDFFMNDSADVLNIPNVEAAFIRKCTELLEKQSHEGSYFISDIQHLRKGDIHYFYFESRSDKFTSGMKRYHLGAFSYMFFDLYYTDSNVIDADKSYTLDSVVERFKNYINSLHKTVNK